MLGEQDGHQRPHRLIAIEGIDDPEMVRICEVGAHNEPVSGRRRPEVYEAMVAVYQKQPFAINFADPAGLKAYFLNPLSEAEAREFEWVVVCLSPEAYNFADEEGVELWELMRRTGELILWWD
jgi:hypothetical protein